jgi:cytochrome bd ubiquinol oxidase subunit II
VAEVWFAILAACLVAYVVLDGFDLGAGALHLIVARTHDERRQVLAAVGPYWDGNEVWLLAAGGVLFVAFPAVLASGLSGFYFAIFLVLWCLVVRGIAIEFRNHVEDPLWRTVWDTAFALASAALALLFGVALGNVVRGVPLARDGWFALSLFTDFRPREPVGILDWYTVLVGLFAVLALATHGAAYLGWKTEGAVAQRSRALARRLGIGLVVLWPIVTWATVQVRPTFFRAFAGRPLAWLAVATLTCGIVSLFVCLRRGLRFGAFLGSTAFLAGFLGATAITMFPVILPSTRDPAFSLTVSGASAPAAGLRIALGWAAIGFPLAILYFAVLFRIHRKPDV